MSVNTHSIDATRTHDFTLINICQSWKDKKLVTTRSKNVFTLTSHSISCESIVACANEGTQCISTCGIAIARMHEIAFIDVWMI